MKNALIILAGSAVSIAAMIFIDESIKDFKKKRREDRALKEALRDYLDNHGFSPWMYEKKS